MRAAALIAGAGACALLLGGCTSEEPTTPTTTATTATADASSASPSASTPGGGTGDAVDAAQYFIDPDDVSVLGSATAPSRSEKGATVTADVLSVEAYEDSTTLVFQLTSSAADDLNGAQGYDDVALLDRPANLRLLPNQFQPSRAARDDSPECLCAYYASPLTTTPIRISLMYPALPEGTTEVEVSVPGFKAIKVPVTRG